MIIATFPHGRVLPGLGRIANDIFRNNFCTLPMGSGYSIGLP